MDREFILIVTTTKNKKEYGIVQSYGKAKRQCIRIEKGMSVEIPTTGYNPLTSNGGSDVAMAFMRIYGLDLKRAGACHLGYLDVVKIG